MRINPLLHSKSLVLKSLLGQLVPLHKNLLYDANELLVLNYHSTPKKYMDNFEHQLVMYQKYFEFISPSKLADYFEGKLVSKKPMMLMTFDDGLKNNLYAATVLKKLNINAFFFLIPDFIETKQEEQKKYYLKNIRPIVNQRIDSEKEDFESMTWTDIQQLIHDGHEVGSHTKSHTMIKGTLSETEREKEIVECGRYIEKMTGQKVSSFCSINNTLLSIGQPEKALINKHYEFHFTTIPGYNAHQRSKHFIKRRNVECYWPDGAVWFAVGKQDLPRWQSKMEEFDKL